MADFEHVLEKAIHHEQRLSAAEIECLLSRPAGQELEHLFTAARERRKEVFGDVVFLYGFVYFSTYCKNRCRFCLYRCSNEMAPRYRKPLGAIIDAIRTLEDSGVHLIDLTMGRDTYYLQQDGNNLLELILKCHESVSLPIMLSPGVLPVNILSQLAGIGVDWYACYQETFNQTLYSNLREGQDFNSRFEAKINAKKAGLLLEEGLLLGVGERYQDTSLAFKEMERLGPSQVRAMSFRPQIGTPMVHVKANGSLRELQTIATFRLCFPDKLIPASLDVDGLEGVKNRLNAGANVITSLIPANYELAGVSSARSGVETGQRSVGSVAPVVESAGLKIAAPGTYRTWLNEEKRRVGRQDRVDSKSMKPGWTPEPSASF